MAKRSSNNGANEPQRPSRLLFPVDEARAKLNERIRAGKELVAIPVRSGEDFAAVRGEFYTWTEYNETLLRRMFDTDDERRGYHGMSLGGAGDTFQGLHDGIRSYGRKLESLRERLDLYQLSPEALRPNATDLVKPAAPALHRNQVFIVHGRDDALKEAAARLVSKLGLTPIVLHEQANQGRTIIQKFMDHAEQAAFALVLLTPDDEGRLAKDDKGQLEPRARQNVILELGYFLGKLGAERVCAIHAGVELPNDFSGVLYVPYDAGGVWRYLIAKEMQAAGIKVDMNQI